jgi:hypothetical protein
MCPASTEIVQHMRTLFLCLYSWWLLSCILYPLLKEKVHASVATQKIVTTLCSQELGTKLQLKSIAK